jgi:hypothetical protein
VDLLDRKFPDRPVDEEAHRRAHGPEAAEELAARGFNRVFLSLNWGFPPEVEERHWEEFSEAVGVYRGAGLQVAGYVQASNCVAEGSYADRDWYAVTPAGDRIPYYRHRLMTCWNHPDWRAEVQGHAVRAVRAGAGVVFFDNIWMGAVPWYLGGRSGGFAGCACGRCRAAFRHACGEELPERLGDDPVSERYLEWRAGVVRRRIGEWREAILAEDPAARVVANLNDAELRDTRALFGVVPGDLARVMDEILVENVAMPGHLRSEGVLIGNALPFMALRCETPGTPVLGLSYEEGIGLDGQPGTRRARRQVAEALALGVAPVVKGTEYLDSRGRFTVFTAPEFRPMREAVGEELRWISRRAGLFRDLVPAPEVGVLHDPEGMRRDWGRTAPASFGVGQALLREAVSFRYVSPGELTGHEPRNGRGPLPPTLVIPPGIGVPDGYPEDGVRVVRLEEGDLGLPGAPGALARSWVGRVVLGPLAGRLAAAYFASAKVRRLLDAAGLTRRFLRSPFFGLPAGSRALRQRLPPRDAPVFESRGVFLVARWARADGGRLVHLVNYEDETISVRSRLDGRGMPALHTPDAGTRLFASGDHLFVDLECHAVLEWPADEVAAAPPAGGTAP